MDIHTIVENIASLSYFDRRVFISKKIKPELSRFLYKYRSINPDDETSIDRLRDIIVKSKLWLSSPKDFNDPFDMSANFLISKNAIEKRNRFKALAKDHGITRKEREKFVKRMMLTSHDELEINMRSLFEKNVSKNGVFSFAGDPRNILMWSHYANNHNGICIQFEVSRDIQTLSHALDVEYSIKYPQVDWVTNFEKSLVDVMLRKHNGWKYEKEERIVLPGYAHKYLEFLSHSVTGIIFGCKAGKDVRDVVNLLLQERINLGGPPIKLYQAAMHHNQYKLRVLSHA